MKGCALKKTLFAVERARADIARHRKRWKAWQAKLDPERLVFIDETWIRTNMAPLRGWGPKGERVRGFAPHGRWHTLTFVGALRCDRFTAPCVFDGPINGVSFLAYVEQLLVPTLVPGDIVISGHKAKRLTEWTISAATSQKPCETPSVPPAPGCGSCPNTPPTSIQVTKRSD